MVHSKAIVIKHILSENPLNRCLFVWTLMQVMFKHVLSSLTSFMYTLNSENVVKYFLSNWVMNFLEVYKELM